MVCSSGNPAPSWSYLRATKSWLPRVDSKACEKSALCMMKTSVLKQAFKEFSEQKTKTTVCAVYIKSGSHHSLLSFVI